MFIFISISILIFILVSIYYRSIWIYIECLYMYISYRVQNAANLTLQPWFLFSCRGWHSVRMRWASGPSASSVPLRMVKSALLQRKASLLSLSLGGTYRGNLYRGCAEKTAAAAAQCVADVYCRLCWRRRLQNDSAWRRSRPLIQTRQRNRLLSCNATGRTEAPRLCLPSSMPCICQVDKLEAAWEKTKVWSAPVL